MALPSHSFQKGLTGLTTGEFKVKGSLYCHVDGTVNINWADGTSVDALVLLAGEQFFTYDVESVEIVTGTFSLARQ